MLKSETSLEKVNRLRHIGSFGLGHRFSKLSAAVDLAHELDVPVVEAEWQDCGVDMFAELFGNSSIIVRDPVTRDLQSKTVLVRNDVNGYYAGQAYKNTQIRITQQTRTNWLRKMERDYALFADLFAGPLSTLRDFQNKWDWHNRTVIGVHIRAGNGESDHFSTSQRGIGFDAAVLARKLQTLITSADRPLLFVATDTESWVKELKSELGGIEMVTFPQQRVAPGEGVGYQRWSASNAACVQGWKSAVSDMALLASSDTLVAATRSTFTQIVPALLVLHKAGGRFCEVGSGSMDCFSDIDSWLFQEREHEAHKLMVHLPDIGGQGKAFESARKFISTSDHIRPEDRVYFYGPKFNKKYRKSKLFHNNWNMDG